MATFSNGESGSSVRTKLNEIINKVEGVSDIDNDLTVDGDFTVTGNLKVQGTTITVDSATAQTIVLGDNDKMMFGAGSDLQIFHDGSNSRIYNSTGNLLIRNDDAYIQSANGTASAARFNATTGVTLYRAGAVKLATTSTGVDVTGTVTADGLTVDGNITSTGGDLNLATLDLNAIAASKAVTAVDVFVYDTSKDSDGGAWRKRTQHTSWYNETLNTATRGARREFPAVAVIVAESDTVTIYDGDDPSLPMWMVFNEGGGNALWSNANVDPTSVAMLNGIMCVGQGGSGAAGFNRMNFVEDSTSLMVNATTKYNVMTIVNRNRGISLTTDGTFTAGLVNRNCNDVAMTVLPDAPIDPATGLPVPTIAVATDGGVSVIKDDGTVVDITNSSSYDRGLSVSFTNDNKIAFAQHSNSNGQFAWYLVYDIPSSDKAHTLNTRDDAVSWFETRRDNTDSDFHILIDPSINDNGDAIQEAVTLPNDELAITCDYGVTKLAEDRPNGTSALGAYITSSYNTGWMNGDIKLATLSDTDATNVTGSELVTNGDFSNGTTGWTASTDGNGTTLSASNNQLTISSDGTSYGVAYQNVYLEAGKTYVFTVYIHSASNLYYVRMGIGGQYSGSGPDTTLITNGEAVYGWNVVTYTPTNSGNRDLQIGGRNDVTSVVVSDVSIRLAEEDRSVNGNGLQVFGTVTRSAVATGAELVAYSGFSASNYLEQPYNADLDFGTGDFCVMGWVKTAAADTGAFFSRGDTALAGARWWFGQLNGVPYVYSSLGSITATGTIPVGSWSHVAFLRLAGVSYFYTNGTLVHSATNTQNLTNTAAIARLGQTYSAGNTFTGSLALLRISATAPTAEQIKKIYEDEKVLFQENAAATLYGSSDAVTALAHDSDTNLLHVGTSAGRSVFQGLRRVSNTTTAVGTAISASNGLVVEE